MNKITDCILMANMRKPIMEILSILSIIYQRGDSVLNGCLLSGAPSNLSTNSDSIHCHGGVIEESIGHPFPAILFDPRACGSTVGAS
jgi:hypothetical protein